MIGYRSTRARRSGAPVVSFDEAMLAGLAPDGGLYWPTRIAPLPLGWETASSPAELALAVLPPYVGDEAAAAIAGGLDFAWPVSRLSDDVFLLELFHGPTAAFKDVGARSLARAMDAALADRGERVTVLTATSGDTGSAVADAFAGLERVRVAVLYPAGGVSAVQEAQLTAARPGVRTFAVAGTFDDCQRLVKAAFADEGLRGTRLSSANSINVGRLLPQLLYYLWGTARTWEASGRRQPLEIVVPSGNLGNLTAGMLAAEAGMPVAGFLAAHNRNDFFPRHLAGEADAYAFSGSVSTPSNAMDVGAPSNFERLYEGFGDDLRSRVAAVRVDDAATFERMRLTYERHGALVCPHTAVGLEALELHRAAARSLTGSRAGAGDASAGAHERGRSTPALVLATAHPAKFPESVLKATGVTPPVPATLERFERMPKRVEGLAAEPAALRAALLDWTE